MNQVKFKVSINVEDPKQVQALNLFLSSIGSGNTQATTLEKKEVVKTKMEVKPKEEEAPKGEAAKETPQEKAEEVKTEAAKDEAPGLKIEEVRALLAKKVNDHRPLIKTKLTELGANNVSSLAVEKYQDFMTFLNGLK